jgi:ribosome-associated protein
MLVVNARLQIPLREFEITFARSSGPGGQNVNKVNSKALLRWRLTTSPSVPEALRQQLLAKHGRRLTIEGDLLISSQRYRDAGRNIADCLEKLRAMLLDAAMPVRPRRVTRPTRASVRRRIENKQHQSAKKRLRRAGGED